MVINSEKNDEKKIHQFDDDFISLSLPLISF